MDPRPIPFEIGLALAGTISAGAYTAGAVDFLIQALDAWQRLKDDPAVPTSTCMRHEVRLKVISGASGGGITAALAALALGEEHKPVTSIPGRVPDEDTVRANRLYDTWVERIDIQPLLGIRDLEEDDNGPVRSLLDSTILDEISAQVHEQRPPRARPYVCDPLHLIVTHTNLRGVPYDITFTGQDKYGLPLSLHADFAHFTLGQVDPDVPLTRWLDPPRQQTENWEAARLAALATGAWPVGLRARLLQRTSGDHKREWPIPLEASEGGACTEPHVIMPNWPAGYPDPFVYEYLVVDGGAMNNEPVELARRELAGEDSRNPRQADKAHRAVLMVDPLVGGDPMTEEEVKRFRDYDLIDVLARLFSSLLNQARFKPDELVLAYEKDQYSRFLIAPRRELAASPGTYARRPLGTASLAAFGGFFSERFRMHDFQLGRRNCQKFLLDWFVLPAEAAMQNEVFAGIRQDLHHHVRTRIVTDENGRPQSEEIIPIIPLYGSALDEVHPLRLTEPRFRLTPQETAPLEPLLNRRIRAGGSRLIDHRLPSGFAAAAKVLLFFTNGRLTRKVMDKITTSLEKWDEEADQPLQHPS